MRNSGRIRVSAIVFKKGRILLMHRRKKRFEYFTLPGGGLEFFESEKEAAARELLEETGLVCTKAKFAFKSKTGFKGKIYHPFYYCEVDGEKLKLGGVEAIISNVNNWYNPEWIDIENLSKVNLLPKNVKQRILLLAKKKFFKKGKN